MPSPTVHRYFDLYLCCVALWLLAAASFGGCVWELLAAGNTEYQDIFQQHFWDAFRCFRMGVWMMAIGGFLRLAINLADDVHGKA